jgi:hypothetical protein
MIYRRRVLFTVTNRSLIRLNIALRHILSKQVKPYQLLRQ